MTDVNDTKQKLVYPAEQVLEKDLVDLRNLPNKRRRNLFNELNEKKAEYEWDFYPEHQDIIPDRTKELDLTSFEAAKLMLATAIEESGQAGGEEQGFIDQFEAEERDFIREFDDFRRKFKNVSKEQLETDIRNKDGEIYEFVEDELRQQSEMRSTLLSTQSNEIRGSIISYFQEEFDAFFELANEAVFLYIKHHGLPNSIEEIVNAAEVTAQASADREAIEVQFEQKLDELAESVHHGLRDQERALRSELTDIRSKLSESGGSGNIERELSKLRDRMEDLSSQRQQDIGVIGDQLEDLESLESELASRIEELDEARQQAIDDLKDETREQAGTLIEEELQRMREQKTELSEEVTRLRNERERLETTGERFDKEYDSLHQRIESTEQRIEEDQEKLEDRLDDLSESIPGDSDDTDGKAIRAQLARLYEQDYIGRFDTSIREARSIALPDGDVFEPSAGYWDDQRRSQSGNHRPIVEEALEDEDAVPDNYPLGAYSIYRVVQTGLAGLTSRTDLVIEAVVKANLTAFAKNGFDARPAGVDDLLDVVNETLAWSEMEDTAHLLGIASPTGWTEQIKNLVRDEDFARTRFSSQVSICLIDIQEDELIYDPNDRLIRENIDLFEREVDSERVSECIDTLQNEYIDDPTEEFISHHEIVTKYDFHPHVVKKAFEHFVEKGLAREQYREELQGLCLFIDRA